MDRRIIAAAAKIEFPVVKALRSDPALQSQAILPLIDIRHAISVALTGTAAMLKYNRTTRFQPLRVLVSLLFANFFS